MTPARSISLARQAAYGNEPSLAFGLRPSRVPDGGENKCVVILVQCGGYV